MGTLWAAVASKVGRALVETSSCREPSPDARPEDVGSRPPPALASRRRESKILSAVLETYARECGVTAAAPTPHEPAVVAKKDLFHVIP